MMPDELSSGGGAGNRFCQREAVGVVLDDELDPDPGLQILAQAHPIQARRIAVLDRTVAPRDRAGGSNTDAIALGCFGTQQSRKLGDDRDNVLVAALALGGDATAHDHLVVGIENNTFDLGAAKIDADSSAFSGRGHVADSNRHRRSVPTTPPLPPPTPPGFEALGRWGPGPPGLACNGQSEA
jgi:hypothetical protein